MARQIYVDLSNSIEAWRQKTNLMGDYIGDLDNLAAPAPYDSSIVSAFNYLDATVLDSSETRNLISLVTSGPNALASLSYNNANGEFTFITNPLTPSLVPALPAGKITSGSFNPARIPNLSATKITSDKLGLAHVPDLPASIITSGILDSNRIPNTRGSKIISELPLEHIPPLPIDAMPLELDSLGFGFPTDLYGSNPDGPVLLTNLQTISGNKTFTGGITMSSNLTINDHVLSASNNSFNIGENTNRFATMYATTFNGVATSSLYADLAEKYTTREELIPGTAVAVSNNEEYEVREATMSDYCIGVISTEPALMMNSEAEGQYVGLKGRVPVRVKGPVNKGQAVHALEDGVSTTLKTTALVGIALETNLAQEEKLVECVLKV